MRVLGISAYYHDAAACLLVNGEIKCAAQEERFTRIKHDASFPINAIQFCLEFSNTKPSEVDYVVFYDKPFIKFERLLETYIANAPIGFKSFKKAMPIWIKEKLFLKKNIIRELKNISPEFNPIDKLLFAEHHFSHAASAFYPSPFQEAVILTLDGVGEWATSTISIGKKNSLKIIKEINFPHSLGLLYSAFTYYVGFKVNSGEYKLMGLAPYGIPKYKKIILDNLIDIKNDGSFRLNQYYFNYSTGLTMINKNFENLFGQEIRKSEVEKITNFHMDIAASIQLALEEIIIKITKNIREEYQIPNLCLAGGVALNCVVNGKLIKNKTFKNIWIQPASGDAGGAIGSAYAAWHHEFNMPRLNSIEDTMKGSFLGPEFSDEEIYRELKQLGAVFEKKTEQEIISLTAKAISNENAVGWFQGKMEFGPRALGGRSILGDPRSTKMQKILNLKVKFRESFRPFAPSILRENLADWFDVDIDSPYMLIVANIKRELQKKMSDKEKNLFGIDKLNIIRSNIPSVTHVDYSARIQTVHHKTNLKYYNLIKYFYDLTGFPILINTSFNVRGEPIVCSPKDAFNCFMGTDLDILSIGNYYLKKNNQNKKLILDYKNKYDLD